MELIRAPRAKGAKLTKTTRAITIWLVVTAGWLAFMVGFAAEAYARPPQCSTYPCTVSWHHPNHLKLGRRRSAGTKTVTLNGVKTSVKCYNQQGWESWDTRSGKVVLYDQVHWCGRAYVQAYKSMTTGTAAHHLVTFWHDNGDTWQDAWATGNRNGIRTEATGDFVLSDPLHAINLEEIQAQLCVNVYANGYAKITCRNK